MNNYENYFFESKTDATEMIQLLEDKIYEHNSTTIKRDDGHLFSKVLRNDKGEVIAGIGGWIWADVCEITQLWVDEKMRGRGIGKALLDAAEHEVHEKGCLTMLLKTYSFQAPGFYLKQGFESKYVISDFPKGFHYYIMAKAVLR